MLQKTFFQAKIISSLFFSSDQNVEVVQGKLIMWRQRTTPPPRTSSGSPPHGDGQVLVNESWNQNKRYYRLCDGLKFLSDD